MPPQIISILGPPGSSKTTQSALLAQNFRLTHLNIGAILRAEANNSTSPWSSLIAANMAAGRIGPKEMSAEMLRVRIEKEGAGGDGDMFLSDGFPRRLDQASYFSTLVCPLTCLIVLECAQEILVQRLEERKRADDTRETICARIRTFEEDTREVVARFEEEGRVVRVASEGDVGEVFGRVVAGLEGVGVVLKRR
ncbi:adenylate kinase-domain-containing protein [Paraphoma chrysanthemicola]|uniref:Adenylate kinase-domain-containing protein n=1 Tax=Paraphoma chrysanthemicola TaxID=798071 RepID=A0A8K0VZI6_9PLEO|nr:adenylate kinase-domain-containing protein [Paraphoma chrysanthemicola]